jgi:hypothetical protein
MLLTHYVRCLGSVTLCFLYIWVLWIMFVQADTDISGKIRHNRSPTFLTFYLPGWAMTPNLLNSTLPVLLSSTTGANGANPTHAYPPHTHIASQHTPAPYGSIILHTESHGALYSQNIPRYLISYPTNAYGNAVTRIVPDYMVCTAFLDPDVRVILHCRHSDDLIVYSFSDVAFSTIIQTMSICVVQLMFDMLLWATILCIDVADKPPLVIRMLRLVFMRNLMLKHDFYCKAAHFNNLDAVCLCPITIVVQNVTIYFGHLCKLIRQYQQWSVKKQVLSTAQKISKQHVVTDNINESGQSNSAATSEKNVHHWPIGGGKLSTSFLGHELDSMMISDVSNNNLVANQKYKFLDYMVEVHVKARNANVKTLVCNCDLAYLVPQLTQTQLRMVGRHHNIFIAKAWTSEHSRNVLLSHECHNCPKYLTLFKELQIKHKKRDNTGIMKCYRAKQSAHDKVLATAKNTEARQTARLKEKSKFPPTPPTRELLQTIAKDFYKTISPNKFEESGCAVCGRLTPMTNLLNLSEAKCNFDILTRDGAGVTQKERNLESDPVEELKGPVMDEHCHSICLDCHHELSQGRTPPLALANGFWIGNVPKELHGLT